MYVLFQYPIIDFRPASSAAKIKIYFPNFPTPELQYRPFIRHFGSVKKRDYGGIEQWAGEEFFCDARRSLRYADLHKQIFSLKEGVNVESVNCHKRFYADGKFMNKVEVCLTNNIETLAEKNNTPVNMIPLLKFYAELPVQVNGTSTQLHRAGRQLAKLYCNSSVLHTKPKKDLSKHIMDGEVCMLLIYAASEMLQLPAQAKKINEYSSKDGSATISLYGYTLFLNGYYLKVWMIQIPYYDEKVKSAVNSVLRNLRIVLMRLHAEKETIRALLNGLKTGKIKLAARGAKTKMVMDYLKDAYEQLFKKRRFNIDQGDMLNFALQSENMASPGSFSTLQKNIKDEFIRKNMGRFLEGSYAEDKKMILFICSSPNDKNPLDFSKDFKAIKDSRENSADKASYTIEIETGVKRTDLGKLLDKYRPDILHVTMHAADQGLFFEDGNGDISAMGPDELADLLKIQGSIHRPDIVVLSACNSSQHAKAIKNHCNYVVGTNNVFPERAAVLYALAFYSMLFNDYNTSVQTCHEAGLHAIRYAEKPFAPIKKILEDETETLTEVWTIPELFSNS